jgi:VanZ family protein
MIFIFIMSSQPHVQASEGPLLNFLILKTFHATGYALLTIAYAWAFEQSLPKQGWWQIAALLAFVYACTDEYHQTFIPTRGGSIRDVGVDLIGVVSVYWLGTHGHIHRFQKIVASRLYPRAS